MREEEMIKQYKGIVISVWNRKRRFNSVWLYRAYKGL